MTRGAADPLDGRARRLRGIPRTRRRAPGRRALEVRGLSARRGSTTCRSRCATGEIVGLAGLVGAGRTSTALALAGALPVRPATSRLDGRPVRFRSPAEAIGRGTRLRHGGPQDARASFRRMAVERRTSRSPSCVVRVGLPPASVAPSAAAASRKAREFDVRAPSGSRSRPPRSRAGTSRRCSSRGICLKPRRLLILDEPTRGVDVGARAEIYALMNRLTDEGLAILMISSDLPEVLGMADRVVVLRDGRTAGELARAEATPERVMALASAERASRRWMSRYAIFVALGARVPDPRAGDRRVLHGRRTCRTCCARTRSPPSWLPA